MATTPSPFTDHAAPILAGDPALSDEQRADLHDAFYQKSPEELVAHLMPLAIPEDTKKKLYQAKQMSIPAPAPLDKATSIMNQMASMDPRVLDIAESHPQVLKTLTAAATAPEKGSESASGGSSSADKGKQTQDAQKPALPEPDVPATPSGHALVQASDGGLYHVPHANIDKARGIDPSLKILHVQPDEEA